MFDCYIFFDEDITVEQWNIRTTERHYSPAFIIANASAGELR